VRWLPFALAPLATVAAGCRLGPAYERPDTNPPAAFRFAEGGPDAGEPDRLVAAPEPGTDAATFGDLDFWEVFADERLVAYVREALTASPTALIATERVLQARAAWEFAFGAQLPQVGVGGGWDSVGISQNGFPKFPNENVGSEGTVAGSFAWDADLFGRLASATEARREEFLASEANRRAVYTALCADVAKAYLLILDLDRRVEVARQTLDSRRKNLELVTLRRDRGVASAMDVRQAETLLYQASAAIPIFAGARGEAENALSLLLGRNPGPIERGEGIYEQVIRADLPPGLPSELLERRPDLVAAERNLAAANARIGEAKAQFFPTIGLTAFGGFQSDSLSNLFNGSSALWTAGISALQPIYTGGRLEANLRGAEARQREATLAYVLAVQRAFREVSDGLVSYRYAREYRIEQDKLADTLADQSRLSQVRYKGGITSYLEVLDSERLYFQSELERSNAWRLEFDAVIGLYRALGGGWRLPEENPP
jgi:NodT family efflux transporter outer membrane factor (OMF) lipoprotein